MAAPTVACESADPTILGGEGLISCACTSSATSSSISVVSVPFEVTGDGPTISLGLVICKPFVLSSIELGRRWEDSCELRADLALISRQQAAESLKIAFTYIVWYRGELFMAGEFGDREKSV